MTDFTADQLARMRATQDGHMQDTCVIQACVQTPNAINELVETWPTDSAALNCGVDMRPGSERRQTDNTVLQYDAVLRLPITTTVNAKDRIKVTHRFGEVLTPALVFEVISPSQRGPSGLRVLLRRIDL